MLDTGADLAPSRDELEPTLLLGARSPFYRFAPIKALKQNFRDGIIKEVSPTNLFL